MLVEVAVPLWARMGRTPATVLDTATLTKLELLLVVAHQLSLHILVVGPVAAAVVTLAVSPILAAKVAVPILAVLVSGGGDSRHLRWRNQAGCSLQRLLRQVHKWLECTWL